MRYALSEGVRILPTPLKKAICPLCKSEVLAKCGKIKIWHWAHINLEDCDSFGEPESEWHLNWKANFPEEMVEVSRENHRADIQTKNGLVIELQHSSISVDQILEREKFYKKMCWLFDSATWGKNLYIHKGESWTNGFVKFYWKWFRKPLKFIEKNIYFDLSDGTILRIYKIDEGGNGWGYLLNKECFIEDILNSRSNLWI